MTRYVEWPGPSGLVLGVLDVGRLAPPAGAQGIGAGLAGMTGLSGLSGMVRRARATGTPPPTSPVTGSYAWYKADAGTGGVGDGDPITTWTDQAASPHNLTNTGGAVRPLYKTNRQNGLPSVLFDGSNDFLNNNAMGTYAPKDYYLVFMQVTWVSAGFMVYTGGSGDLWQAVSTPQVAFDAGAGSAFRTSGVAVGAWVTVRVKWNGASSAYSINGGAETTGNAGAGGNTTTLNLGNAGGGNFANWELGECLIYTSILSDADRDINLAYLRGRWATW
jgi:hypothetical protein